MSPGSDMAKLTIEQIRQLGPDEVTALWERVKEIRPTVGAYRKPRAEAAFDWSADLDRLLVEDPRCLSELVLAGVRCGRSLRDSARFALEEADRLGIDPAFADEVVRDAVRKARRTDR